MKVNLLTLEEAVNDYFNAQQEFKTFLRTWVPGWWENKTPRQREDYTKYYERSTCKYDAIVQICKLLSIDLESLCTIIKSFNKYTKHNGKWDRYIGISRLTHQQSENFLTLISNNPEKLYYKSTGRRKPLE